jgi:hypothetical protein
VAAMTEKKKLVKADKKRENPEIPYKVINGQKIYAKKEYLSENSTHFRYSWDGAEG